MSAAATAPSPNWSSKGAHQPRFTGSTRPRGSSSTRGHDLGRTWQSSAKATLWHFPFRSFDLAVMALVIFFVPDPAKGVAEMVRVVSPGGTVAAYAWDVAGGGFPLQPVQAALLAIGFSPVRPPPSISSKIDARQHLCTYDV